MYLYTAEADCRHLPECNEGELKWIPKNEVFRLNLWEGDRIFLNYLLEDTPFFCLELHYDEEDRLVSSRRLPPIILASASPRRLQLLQQIGLDPIVIPSRKEEHPSAKEPAEIVKELSIQKALDIAVPDKNMQLLFALVGALVGIYAVSVLFTTIRSKIMVDVSQEIIYDIRKDLFEHLQELPFQYPATWHLH